MAATSDYHEHHTQDVRGRSEIKLHGAVMDMETYEYYS